MEEFKDPDDYINELAKEKDRSQEMKIDQDSGERTSGTKTHSKRRSSGAMITSSQRGDNTERRKAKEEKKRAEQVEQIRQERIAAFKDWILLNERLFLIKVEKLIDQGQDISQEKIKKMRGEIVVPPQFRKLVLDDSQLKEL